jgi:hypothetical protein
MPGGFVGDSGLSVRLRYTSAGTTWNWLNYYANNADGRYLKQSGGTLTGQLKADDSTSAATPGYAFDGDPNTGIGRPGADELALITGGSARLTVDSAGNIAVAAGLSQGGNAVVTTNDSRLTDTRTPADGTVTDAKVASGAAIDKTKIGGTAITAADTGTITSTMIADGTIQNADINAAAAIDKTKISGTAITTADTGTVTSTMIADGQITSAKIADATIVNQDVSLSAAIAGTKVSPDFGSQNVTTTGTVTGASLSPTSSSVPTNGVYLPAANSVAVATNGTGRLFVDSSGRVLVGTSSARTNVQRSSGNSLTPTIQGETASGNFPAYSFLNNSSGGFDPIIALGLSKGSTIGSNTAVANGDGIGQLIFMGNDGTNFVSSALILAQVDGTPGTNDMPGRLIFGTTADSGSFPTERMRIDSSGRVGIGVTSPGNTLHVENPAAFDAQILAKQTASTAGVCAIRAQSNSALVDLMAGGSSYGVNYMDQDEAGLITQAAGDSMRFNIGGSYCRWTFGSSEKARLDSSGRLLVGTSTARNLQTHDAKVQLEGVGYQNSTISIYGNAPDSNGSYIQLGKSRGSSLGSNTIVQNGDQLGAIHFLGADGTNNHRAAWIIAEVDGIPGANDMPGRLVFSTTADGASSPTERMRIASNGAISTVVPGGSTLYPAYDCRAWVNFNGTGTVAIRASGNVSSITDNGIGQFAVNFTTSLPDSNYAAVCSGGSSGISSGMGYMYSPATGSTGVEFVNAGDQLMDPVYATCAVFR